MYKVVVAAVFQWIYPLAWEWSFNCVQAWTSFVIFCVAMYHTSKARSSRVMEVLREGRTYKDKGEPIGTVLDRLAGTAVDCVISWRSLSLRFLALDIFVWCFSWSGLLLTFLNLDSPACRQLWCRTVDTFSLLTSFFWCHRCLWNPMSFQPLSVNVSFSWHPYLWASLFLETFYSLLSTSYSLDTVFAWHHFSCFLLFHTFILRPLSVKIVSFDTFCLEAVFHSHICFFWHFRTCTTKPAQRTSQYYFVLQSVHTALAQSTSQYYFVLQGLHKALPSTTSYYTACTKYFPVLFCTSYYKACTKYYFPVLLRTTKLAQHTSQYYFVVQSLHKVIPSTTSYYTACTMYLQAQSSTTLYYKACTKYFPVPFCTTKLAQSTSQHYFVLQSLHKVLPSTTSYYKARTKYSPVLLRTTKLAQSTSQYYILRTTELAQNTSHYYFVLRSLRKVLPSTTSYYKACTKHLPVLLRTLRTTKLAQSTSQYYFVRQSFYTQKLFHSGAFTEQSFYTAKFFHYRSFCIQKLLDSKAFTHQNFWDRNF